MCIHVPTVAHRVFSMQYNIYVHVLYMFRLVDSGIPSATANDDYTITGSELTLIPSRTNSCAIDINIVNDVAVELTESVTVSLSLIERHNRVRITQPTATVLITDDDGRS